MRRLVLEDLDPKLTIMTVPVLVQRQDAARHRDPGIFARHLSAAASWKRFARSRRRPLSRLLILVPLGWLWGKQIASPLLRLSSAIRQVAQAPAATVAFKAPAGKDEIAELGATFNNMVDGLGKRRRSRKKSLRPSGWLRSVASPRASRTRSTTRSEAC